MNKNIIIIAIIVLIIAIMGIFAFSLTQTANDEKLNTQITFLSQSTLRNGEAVQFELKDANGNLLANQNITITFVENGENQTYSIITDSNGKGALVLNNEEPGDYEVTVTFAETERYYGSSAKQTITVEDGSSDVSIDYGSDESESISQNSSAGTSLYNGNSSDSQQLHYDSQYNFYYDDNGVIRGGQNDGYSADYIRSSYESGNMIDEDGNLQ